MDMIDVEILNPIVKDSAPVYEGSYNVIPSKERQTLETSGKKLEQDVKIQPINNQTKSVEYNANGEYTVQTDEGYDGMDEVEVNVDVQPELQTKSVEYTANGQYSVTADSGYDGLGEVNVKVALPSIPSKGTVIKIDMDGDGVEEDYRVVKSEVGSNVVELLAQFDIGTSSFSNSTWLYDNSPVDNMLNSTWYSSLSEIAKQAIVDKIPESGPWSDISFSPCALQCYMGKTLYAGSLASLSSKHIYLLSAHDVMKYFNVPYSLNAVPTDATISSIKEMFNSESKNIWFSNRGYYNTRYDFGFEFNATSGFGIKNCSVRNYLHPAFQIDLSKITWSLA